MAYSKQENKFTLFAQMNRLISNSFFTNFLASSLTRFFNLGISFISSIIVSRYLGPEGRGYLAFMLSIGLTVSQFFAFGVPAMNTYILSKNEKNKMAVAANSILILALLSVIISFFIFVIFPFYYEVRLIDQLSILFFSIFNLMGLFFSNALLGLMRVGSFNKLEIIRTTSATVAILILIYTGAQNYIYFFLASVFSVIVYGSVSFIFLVNIKQIKSLFNSIDIFLIKNFTSFVSKSYFSSLLAYLITRINFFVIPLFLNDKELGIYATAYSFLDILVIHL